MLNEFCIFESKSFSLNYFDTSKVLKLNYRDNKFSNSEFYYNYHKQKYQLYQD